MEKEWKIEVIESYEYIPKPKKYKYNELYDEVFQSLKTLPPGKLLKICGVAKANIVSALLRVHLKKRNLKATISVRGNDIIIIPK